jgi:hypothetical protein
VPASSDATAQAQAIPSGATNVRMDSAMHAYQF